ncbi:hypothetical protein V6Z11_D04G152200 [Gossypium hirsutum]
MAAWFSVIKTKKRYEIFSLSLEEWLEKNLSESNFTCDPSEWQALFGNICGQLWVKRNKYVFNADFIETGSVLERSLWMRDSYLQSNHGMEYPLRHTTVRSCRLRKWTSPEDGW